MTLAPHTRHHPLLDRVPLETAIEEIAGSHADLEREIGPLAPIPRVLAYPSGAHGGSAVTAAREAGMDIAMTTDRGGNDLRRVDRLRLRRINVGGRAGVPSSAPSSRGPPVWTLAAPPTDADPPSPQAVVRRGIAPQPPRRDAVVHSGPSTGPSAQTNTRGRSHHERVAASLARAGPDRHRRGRLDRGRHGVEPESGPTPTARSRRRSRRRPGHRCRRRPPV